MLTLTTPNPGSGARTHTIWYDGNGNILTTQDFKGTLHYYRYDSLGRAGGRRRVPRFGLAIIALALAAPEALHSQSMWRKHGYQS